MNMIIRGGKFSFNLPPLYHTILYTSLTLMYNFASDIVYDMTTGIYEFCN